MPHKEFLVNAAKDLFLDLQIKGVYLTNVILNIEIALIQLLILDKIHTQ